MKYVVVAFGRRTSPNVRPLKALPLGVVQVADEQLVVDVGAQFLGPKKEHRVQVGDVDAARVRMGHFGAVLLDVHAEKADIGAVYVLEGEYGFGAKGELFDEFAVETVLHHGLDLALFVNGGQNSNGHVTGLGAQMRIAVRRRLQFGGAKTVVFFGAGRLTSSHTRLAHKLAKYLLHVQGAYLVPFAATVGTVDKLFGLFVIVFHLNKKAFFDVEQRLSGIVANGHCVAGAPARLARLETLHAIGVLVAVDVGPRLIGVIVQIVDGVARYRATHLIAVAEEDLGRKCVLLTATVAHVVHGRVDARRKYLGQFGASQALLNMSHMSSTNSCGFEYTPSSCKPRRSGSTGSRNAQASASPATASNMGSNFSLRYSAGNLMRGLLFASLVVVATVLVASTDDEDEDDDDELDAVADELVSLVGSALTSASFFISSLTSAGNGSSLTSVVTAVVAAFMDEGATLLGGPSLPADKSGLYAFNGFSCV
ncbi:hypothetical protein BpHYR1_053195 [Brachionus plicatilis]|uniref:Uncharacterized protein n=1 Tax=Brachionus plicatilis TaxID=10195 RepID=A0A3M7ST34_BRAPC|nr:hypothetical protein BpHYR1_053195 [Brachionus plicatilis]